MGKSGCAYNGITDVLTNLLMKVQCDAVSGFGICVCIWNFLLCQVHIMGTSGNVLERLPAREGHHLLAD